MESSMGLFGQLRRLVGAAAPAVFAAGAAQQAAIDSIRLAALGRGAGSARHLQNGGRAAARRDQLLHHFNGQAGVGCTGGGVAA